MPDPGIFGTAEGGGILHAFTSVLTLGWTGVTPEALWLLNQVSMWFLLLMLATHYGGLDSMLPDVLWAFAKVAILAWVLTNLHTLTDGFARLVIQAGLIMGGSQMTVQQFMNPSAVLLQGWNVTLPIYTSMLERSGVTALLSIVNYFSQLIYAGGVLIPMWFCFFLMAAHIVIAVIEFQMISLFAVIMIPWGIFGPTAFMAEGALNGILASGVRLGILALVTSVLMPWITRLAITPVGPEGLMNATVDIWTALSASAGAGLMAMISWFAPRYASAFFGGAPAFTGSTLLAGVAGIFAAGRRLVGG